MLGLILYNLISFQHSFSIDRNERVITLDIKFGFLPGGNYSFQITDGENDSFLFMIGTNKEINDFNDNEDLYLPCTANITNKNFHIVHLKDGNAQFSGIIEKKGNYMFQIKSCRYFSGGFKFNLTCKNPNSCIGFKHMKYVKATPIIAIFSSILLVIWIVNWTRNCSFQNSIHIMLTLIFLLFTIEKYLLIMVGRSSVISESLSKWLIVQIYLYSLKEFYIFLTFSLVMLGFGLVDNPIKIYWFIIIFFSSLGIALATICYIYSFEIYIYSLTILLLLFILIFFILAFRFLLFMESSTNESTYDFFYYKLHFLSAFTYLIKNTVIFFCVYAFILIPIGVVIVNDVFDFIILFCLGYIFRMKKGRETNYFDLINNNNNIQVSSQNRNNDTINILTTPNDLNNQSIDFNK